MGKEGKKERRKGSRQAAGRHGKGEGEGEVLVSAGVDYSLSMDALFRSVDLMKYINSGIKNEGESVKYTTKTTTTTTTTTTASIMSTHSSLGNLVCNL